MRGNDVLQGHRILWYVIPLTGNIMVKMLSSYSTRNFEASGYGYGPGIGEDYEQLVMMIFQGIRCTGDRRSNPVCGTAGKK